MTTEALTIITRKEALAQGLTHYFTGKPCKHGHVEKRFTACCLCLECNRQKVAAIHAADPEAHRQRQKARYHADPEAARMARRNQRKAKPESYQRELRRNSARNAANQGRYRAAKLQYYKENFEKIQEYKRDYARLRRASDPVFAIVQRLRWRAWYAIAQVGGRKSLSTMTLAGCTREELMVHIEAQFLPGMTWENRSEWHIDHIRPCASFDLLDPDQQRECFHYTNLQPLWGVDNMKKGAKW